MMRGAVALAFLGEKERAKEWASRALAIEPDDDPIDQYSIACAFANMNELDQAVDQLESCLRKMSPEFILWVKQDGDLMPLHNRPRLQALIASGEANLRRRRPSRQPSLPEIFLNCNSASRRHAAVSPNRLLLAHLCHTPAGKLCPPNMTQRTRLSTGRQHDTRQQLLDY
jgi:tetratricopeptide (TPR) repeat protein